MSDVLLIGLSDPEAGAIEVLMGRRWPNLKTLRIARSMRLELPAQDLQARNCTSCIIDLLSTGLRKRDAATEAALLAFLAGRPAILLSRDPRSGWSEQPWPASVTQQIIVIGTPYSSSQLLAGLVQIHDLEHLSSEVRHPATAPPTPPRHTKKPVPNPVGLAADEPPLPAWRRAIDLAERLRQPGTPDVTPPAPRGSNGATPGNSTGPRDVAVTKTMGLRTGAFPALLRMFPELRTQPLLGLGERVLDAGDALMLHFNSSVACVACIQQGWVATGLRMPMMLKMLGTCTAIEQVTLQPLTSADAELVVRERFGALDHRMRLPLDMLCWELVATWFPAMELRPNGDLHLRLKRLPNFNRLEAVGPLDVQLAAACARAPQSVVALARQFPGREQEVYRFAVLTLLSGAAQVVPERGTPAALVATGDAQRRGFFKSLLDRLF